MATATSEVEVCNLAMDILGQAGNVSNIQTPQTEEEIKCSRWYDVVRRAILRAHPWVFARARFQASRDSVTPVFGYADAYNLPNDLLRLNFIGADDINDYKEDYVFEGRQLLLNNSGAASINIGYTKDENNVVKFDALFLDLFVTELAWRMAFAFTLKPSLKKEIQSSLMNLRAEARAVNSQERPPKRIQTSKFTTARKSLLSNVAGKNTVFAQ